MPQVARGIDPAELARVNARVQSDPDIRRVLDAERSRLVSTRDQGGAARDYQNGIRDLISHIAKQKGLLPEGFFVNPNDGNLEPARGWHGMEGWQKALAIGGIAAATLATAGAFGVGPLAAMFGGGGGGAVGAGAGASSAAGVGATTGVGSTAGVGVGAGTGVVAGASGAGGLASSLLRYGLPVGAGIASQVMQNRSNNQAYQLESESYRQALEDARNEREYGRRRDLDQESYNRAQYADTTNYGRKNYANTVRTLEPYRAAGVSATQQMARHLGITLPEYAGPTYDDVGRDAGTPVNLPQTPKAPGYVWLEDPDGQRQAVPEAQAAHYLQLGAKRIG